MSFGQRFGALMMERREKLNLTQIGLAEKAFGSKGARTRISEIEAGRVDKPHARTIAKIAAELEISEEEIESLRSTQVDPSTTRTKEFEKKGVNNLPQLPGTHFYGRDADIQKLDQAILRGNAAITQTIQGLGGVGKTALAIHYARLPEVAARFPIRWWVSAETREGIEKGLGDLGRRLEFVPVQTPDAEAAKQTLAWLREAPRQALILFDNVEDGPLLAEFLPGDATATLVTTRVRGMGGLAQVSLDCWQPETARDFLLERTGSDDATAALALAEALGGLPLACEQAGAYCAEAGETLAGYLTRFQASPAKMMSRRALGSAQEDTVAKTFALAIDRAAADCAGARVMLSVMAELAPEPLPLAVFGHEMAPEGLRDAEDASDAADALVRWALVERVAVRDALRVSDTPCLSAHRLVRLAATDTQAGVGFEVAARALGGAFPTDPDINVEGWPLCGALLPHASSILARVTGFSTNYSDPKNFTLALNAAALFCDYSRGDYALARSMFEAALEIEEAAYGPDHPSLATRLSNLAAVLRNLGGDENLKAARAALERALKIDEAAYGSDHPSVGIDHLNMAPLLDQLGNRAGALQHAKRALAIFTASLGAEHGHTQNAAGWVKKFGG